ncbi:MAG: hypothetical protein V7629_09090 [Motiliproteus sp.]
MKTEPGADLDHPVDPDAAGAVTVRLQFDSRECWERLEGQPR